MSKWWKKIDWRCIQMNFREIDMLDVKTDEIIKNLKEFDATVFMINTGGIIASYDSKLPFQHQSEFLKSDSLKSIIDACHKEGIRVIARMDFSKIREDIFKLHPEWAFRTENNDVINYNGNISACMNAGYQQEAIFEILGEVIDVLNVDGFYFNMSGMFVFDYDLNFYGNCHCEACKTSLKEQYGIDIPKFSGIDLPVKVTDKRIHMAARTPEMFKYSQFTKTIETSLIKRIHSYIREKDNNCAIMNVDFKRSESNSEIERPLPRMPYKSSMKTRLNLGTDQKMISSNTSVDFVGFSFRHVSVSPALQSLRLWQALANFGGLDYYLIGRLDNHQDKTAFDAIKTVFNHRAKHEKVYMNLINQAQVLLIHNTHPHKPSREEQGWVLSLTENHIPFAEVHQSQIKDNDLDQYKVVISTGKVSKTTSKLFETYVAKGGTLLLTGALSKDNILHNLAGISKHTKYDKEMESCMFIIDKSDRPFFPKLDKTEVIFFGTLYDKYQFKPGVETLLKVSKPQLFGPPELVYGTGIDDFPGVVINNYKNGKVVYTPSEAGATYFREGWENTSLFMSSILTSIIGLHDYGPTISKTTEITHGYNKEKNYDVVQLVNTNGFFGIQVYEPSRLYNLDLEIPIRSKIDSVKTLSMNKPLPYKVNQNSIDLTLNELDAYDAIIIQYK